MTDENKAGMKSKREGNVAKHNRDYLTMYVPGHTSSNMVKKANTRAMHHLYRNREYLTVHLKLKHNKENRLVSKK
jgi:hypothetical protein